MADPAQARFDDSESIQADGVSAEDRSAILKEIERVANDNRILVSVDRLAFTARRNGAIFPILVNVVGLVILAGGVLGLAHLFQADEARLRQSAEVVVTAESRLIEAIRRETEEQIAAREAEIASIQEQLDSIGSQRARIAADIDQQLAAREAELRDEFEATLAAERRRLLDLNLSDAEIDRRLAAFQADQARAFEARLAAARNRSLEQQDALEAELGRLEQQYSASLSAADTARRELLAESEGRLTELQQQFEANLAAGEAQLSQAEAQLAELARQREREAFVRAQIHGLYANSADAIDAGDFDTARGSLRDLRTLLNEENTLRLEALREERPVELFLIESLESLVGYEQRFGDPATIGRLSDAGFVQEVSALAERAARAAAAGNTSEATRLYRAALNVIPAIEESAAFLGQRTDSTDARERATIDAAAEAIVIEARRTLEARDYPAAVELYSRAVRDYPTSRFRVEALGGITTAVDAIVTTAEQAQDRLSSDLPELETTVTTLTETTEIQAASIATLQRDLSAAESELRTTLDDLAAAETETAQLQAALARDRTESTDDTQQRSGVPEAQTAAELDELRNLATRLAVAQEAYGEYRRRTAATPADADKLEVINARVALGAFLNRSAMSELFPGLSAEFARYERAYVESGRENALLDAADLLIELSEALRPIERVEIVEDALSAAEDPAYREFLEELSFLLRLEL